MVVLAGELLFGRGSAENGRSDGRSHRVDDRDETSVRCGFDLGLAGKGTSADVMFVEGPYPSRLALWLFAQNPLEASNAFKCHRRERA